MVYSGKTQALGRMMITALAVLMLYGCGGGGPKSPLAGGADLTSGSSLANGTTRALMSPLSMRLNNYNNWGFPTGTAAAMDAEFNMLVRRNSICMSEHYERANGYVAGWNKLTPTYIRSVNPSAKVYRYYSLMSKPNFDTDWSKPSDTRRFQCPLSKAAIDANDWWLRDGTGAIVTESSSSYLLDVGKPGFKEAFLQAVLDRNAGKGFNGFLFDYWWTGISNFLGTKARPAAYPTDQAWFDNAWKPFVTYVMDGVHQAGYRIVGNCVGEYGTCSSQQQFQRSKVDAVVYEQSAVGWASAGSSWLTSTTIDKRIRSISTDPLEVWVCDGGLRNTAADYDTKQAVSVAMYYISLANNNMPRSYHHAYDWNPYWRTLWDFNIGVPSAPYAKQSDAYFWSRKFTRGLVLLNYDDTQTVSWTLDRTYIDTSGKTISGTVSVAPHTCMILKIAT